MKKIISSIIVFCSFKAMGHGKKLEMVDLSVSEALALFKSEADPATLQSFSGVKSWASGAKIKVRVYFNSNKDSIVYSCAMQHRAGQETMKCE